MQIYAELSEEDIEDIYKRVSQNIKSIRTSKNISQQEIALAMGFTTQLFIQMLKT